MKEWTEADVSPSSHLAMTLRTPPPGPRAHSGHLSLSAGLKPFVLIPGVQPWTQRWTRPMTLRKRRHLSQFCGGCSPPPLLEPEPTLHLTPGAEFGSAALSVQLQKRPPF